MLMWLSRQDTVELMDGCYGSLTGDEHAQLVAEYPFWYHVTRRENLAAILREGLLPWDELGRCASHESMLPRPGCVYLVDRDREEWGWISTNLDGKSGVILAVPLAALEPERILPDEDDFNPELYGEWDAAAHGLEPICDGEKPGLWAEQVRLGAQPGLVYELARCSGRIAVRGRIAAELLQVIEPSPCGVLLWEQAQAA